MLYLDKEQVVGLKFKSQVTGQKCLRIYLYHILKTHWVHGSEKLHPLIGTKEVAKVIAILNAMREETKRFPSMIIYAILTGHSSTFSQTQNFPVNSQLSSCFKRTGCPQKLEIFFFMVSARNWNSKKIARVRSSNEFHIFWSLEWEGTFYL